MKRSIFPLKSVCLLSILILITLSITAQKKGTIAYSKKINGNDVVICPVKKVTDTLFLKLSSLVESCEFVKLQNTPEAFFDRGWHTEISDKYICIKSYGQLPAKIAAIGVKIDARGISRHGFALNVNPDMAYWDGIIGCGLEEYPVTSLTELSFPPSPMEMVIAELVDSFGEVFNYKMVVKKLHEDRAIASFLSTYPFLLN